MISKEEVMVPSELPQVGVAKPPYH